MSSAELLARPSREIVIAATLDTKSTEIALLLEEFHRYGLSTVLIDCGILGEPGLTPAISHHDVAHAGGATIDELRREHNRETALPVMMRGLRNCVSELYERGLIGGFCAVGGGTNTAFASAAFSVLPFGFPKLLASTTVSGSTRPIIGVKDVVLVHSVIDILGNNSFLRSIFRRCAALMRAMVEEAGADFAAREASCAITTYGATTAGANYAAEILSTAGLEVIAFHARGTGGQAVEALIRDGRIPAFLDLTTSEVADEIAGGEQSAGPDRLTAAAAMGVPQVVLPGAIDMVNFGPLDSVPARYAGRKFACHTPAATLMRTTIEENEAMAIFVTERLNKTIGPASVVIPMRGYSAYDIEGGPFFDPAADAAFRDTLAARLRADIPLHLVDAHINDRKCMEVATAELLAMLRRSPPGTAVGFTGN
jgi:uncharacterized protein (UPF0261 family)